MKESRKKLRDSKGRILRDADGCPLVSRGDTVRGSLHRATYYGKIMRNGELITVVHKPVGKLSEKDVENIIHPAVKSAIMKAVAEYGSLKEALTHDIFVGSDRFPVRHVRIKPFLQNTFDIGEHQTKSRFSYKNGYHVMNEVNDFMIIRNETSADVRDKSFQVFSNYDAVKLGKGLRVGDNDRVVRKGIRVLFYEKEMKELAALSRKELSARLFRVIGLGVQMIFRHHLDVGSKTDGKPSWSPDRDCAPAFVQQYNKWPFAVEGRDFVVSKTGDIKFLF